MKIDISLIIYVIGAISLFICSLINWILIYHLNTKSKKNNCEKCEIAKSMKELNEKYDELKSKCDFCDFVEKFLETMALLRNDSVDRKDDD